MTVKIRGMQALQRNVQRMAVQNGRMAAVGFLDHLSNEVLEHSKSLTPVDSGDLRGTAFASEPEGRGAEFSSAVVYTADHAVPVHERTEVRHDTGQAKFLETAVDEAPSKFKAAAAHARAGLFGGGL